MNKLAVVGSRDFGQPERIIRWLTDNAKPTQTHIVTGDAKNGADYEAIVWAKAVKCPYTVYPANWYPIPGGTIDRGAGFKRNAQIVAESENMVCFWNELSHGTAHDIHLWYMKSGHQPLILNGSMEMIVVPHQKVIEMLGITRR